MDELANVTDEELRDVLEDMGYHLRAHEFDDLKDCTWRGDFELFLVPA